MKQGILNRNVTQNECLWLENNLMKGTKVYEYLGCTYGCIGDGEAVSLEPDQTPFMEIPLDAIDWKVELTEVKRGD